MRNSFFANLNLQSKPIGSKPIRSVSCYPAKEYVTLADEIFGDDEKKPMNTVIHIEYKDGTEKYYKVRGKKA